MLVAFAQQPQTTELPTPDDTFRDLLDVAGIAISLALVVLVIAVTWPGIKRWLRHRLRRHRRRHHPGAHTGQGRVP